MRTIQTALLKPEPCQLSSFAIASDLLDTANRVAGLQGSAVQFRVQVLRPEDHWHARNPPDLVILPGLGLATAGELRSAMSTDSYSRLMRQLMAVPGPDTVIAAACSGCFALGSAGLLDGKQATTTWWLSPLLQEMFPAAKLNQDPVVVQDGRLFTAGAAFAQIDLTLGLIEHFGGFALAEDCRRFSMADSRPSQLPYMSAASLVAADPHLQRAELFARRNISAPLTVPQLACAGGLEPRTFARRLHRAAGMTPTAFLQTLRVTEAIRIARTTRRSNDRIAADVGYSDATALRRVLRKRTGRTLESYRTSPLPD